MAGYGNSDDAIGAVQAHIDDSLALHAAKMAANTGNDTGLCLECGEPIPAARLHAIPGAKYCIQCQRELDARGGLTFIARNPYCP